VGFAELRALIGLHAGQGVLREAGAGVLCYLGAVPFLAFGLAVYALLSILRELVAGGGAPPSHPAVDQLGSAGPAGVALLFLLAAVVAPIVEEIAFRGVLYGHLRGVLSPRIRVVSALVAALVSSFIFAVVHPQGILFVPALGGLAVGFCLFRELRGSLIAPMVAHGINNAVTLTIGLWLMG
jgi:membrane protease YdiL (CAAX protease family)